MYECVILNAVKDLIEYRKILRKLRILVAGLVAGKNTATEPASILQHPTNPISYQYTIDYTRDFLSMV